MMKRIYFLGIGGSAMGQVASLFKNQGYMIGGTDGRVYPPMSEYLSNQNIAYHEGYAVADLEAFQPDLVVVGNVLSRGQPLIEWLLRTRAYPYISLPELISKMCIGERRSVVITGTHGKTTTTAAAAYLMQSLGYEPGYLIGGVPHDLPQGAQWGADHMPFVIEGDEYDSAFFDKRSKFLHYQPHVLGIGNLEFDHADVFHDLKDIQRTFKHLIALVPSNGCILHNADDRHLSDLLPVAWTNCISIGTSTSADLRIQSFASTATRMSFELVWRGKMWGTITSTLNGFFNARNLALAALSVSMALEMPDPTVLPLEPLAHFHGVKRRQQLRYCDHNHLIFEDFAHHPTAIQYTLEAFKQKYPQARLWAMLEPRSNTLVSPIFQEPLAHALSYADQIYLAPVYRAHQLDITHRLNTQTLSHHPVLKGKAYAFDDFQQLSDHFKQTLSTHQHTQNVIIFLSNGAFGGLIDHFSTGIK